MDLIDDVQCVQGRHLMENIGIVDQVESLRLKPGEILCRSLVELNVCGISERLPGPRHPDVGSRQIHTDHLGLGEDLGEDEGGETRSGADVENSLWFFISVEQGDPLSDLVLVQKVELALAEVGDPAGVTVQVTAGQEVYEGEIVEVRDGTLHAGRSHVRVVLGPGEGGVGVEVAVEELQVTGQVGL